MSLKFKFIPLTFQKDEDEIKTQIRNTIILRHLFEKSNKTVPLKALIESTQYGYNASALLSGKNKFLRISDISNGKVDWETVPFCDCDNEDTYLLYTNDLLIARTGGTTGKSFLITDPPKHSIYAGYLIRIRANKDANPLFLNLFLNSYVYWSQIVSLNEGEFRPSVNANTIKSLILPKCSLEQQLIAIKLSNNEHIDGYDSLINEINNAITNYDVCKSLSSECQRQKDLLEPLKQTILHEAIQGKLTANWRNQNPNIESATSLYKRMKVEEIQQITEKKRKSAKQLHEMPFELPNSWSWYHGFDLLKPMESKRPYGEFFGYIDIASIDNKTHRLIEPRFIKVTEAPSRASRKVYSGSTLFSLVRPYLGNIAYIEDEYSDCIASTGFFVCTPYSFVFPKYLFYLMISGYVIEGLNKYMKGVNSPSINTDDILNYLYPLPPLEEQKIIVDIVDLLIDKCQKLNQELETLDKHGKTLMKAMFNETFETKK